VLESTYGTIVYQEQVMQIAARMAGYNLGEADLLRRAMAKKKREVMKKQRVIFVDRSAQRSIKRATAEQVFDQMAHFAEYGFNRSHSAGYAVLAYQTAFLKAHYPVEFMAATLSSEINDSDRLMILLGECRRMGIDVLPPDVLHSEASFSVAEGAVRFGLGAVKGVGRAAAEAIVAARKEEGPFRGFHHFCAAVEGGAVNRKAVEGLIQAGALDAFEGDRCQMMAALPAALERAQHLRRDREAGQSSLFGSAGGPGGEAPGVVLRDPPLPEVEPWDQGEALRREKTALGFYLSHHPLDPYRSLLTCLQMPSAAEALARADRTRLELAGVVAQVRTGSTSRGEPMAAITLEDLSGRIDVLFFGEAFQRARPLLEVDRAVFICGRIAARDGRRPRVFADRVSDLKHLGAGEGLSLHLALCGEDSNERFVELRRLLSGFATGKMAVFMHVDCGASHGAVLQYRTRVALQREGLEALVEFLGAPAVRLLRGDSEQVVSSEVFASPATGGGAAPPTAEAPPVLSRATR
jgi:DNA polymerase-3 subunit alpha